MASRILYLVIVYKSLSQVNIVIFIVVGGGFFVIYLFMDRN